MPTPEVSHTADWDSTNSSPSITSLELPSYLPDEGIAIDISPSVEFDPRASREISSQWSIKLLALLTACLLSLGTHYGSYLLGPLKTSISRQMGTSNTQFSILLASFSLNNTWTPLVAGIFTARRGTAIASITASSIVLSGQAMMLLGRWIESVPVMTLGCFVFGLGISPLAVSQETIICRYFDKGLGVSLALGLVAGKGASFLSSITSFPLSRIDPIAPFVVATLLAGLSFLINLVYLFSSKWLSRKAGLKPEGSDPLPVLDVIEEEVVEKRKVKISDLHRLGDPFWIYMGLNVLCGTIWSPFLHLSANIIQRRYALSESSAAQSASLLLAGPIILYPLCGIVTDLGKTRNPNMIHHLLILSSILTLFCYVWLSLPTSLTGTPVPGVVAWGIGHGFATLLLVLAIPPLVPVRYVSTALGAHKSIESAGSTLATTLAGLLLDKKARPDPTDPSLPPPDTKAVHTLLLSFLFFNILQLCFILWLWREDVARTRETELECELVKEAENGSALDTSSAGGLLSPAEPTETMTLLDPIHHRKSSLKPLIDRYRSKSQSNLGLGPGVQFLHGKDLEDLVRSTKGMAMTRKGRRRGKRFMVCYWMFVASVWVVFLGVVAWKLGNGEGKELKKTGKH
ncbi:hypothetical protein P7C73_g2380, partial [Tremellales sp. Uapishka_1]